MTKISRRQAIQTVSTTALAAAISSSVDANVVDLDSDFIALEAELIRLRSYVTDLRRAYGEAEASLPEWARSGHRCGWPKHEPGSFLMRSGGFGVMFQDGRPSLDDVRKLNRHTEIFLAGDSDKRARRRAEGRDRVRAWIKKYREQRALRRPLETISAKMDDCFDRMGDIEDCIVATPAVGFAGIAVKLRLNIHYMMQETGVERPEDLDLDGRGVVSALRDCERRVLGSSRDYAAA